MSILFVFLKAERVIVAIGERSADRMASETREQLKRHWLFDRIRALIVFASSVVISSNYPGLALN
jgi:hypothetical protein